jgi:hypothetical protein
VITTVAISYRQPDGSAWGGRLADQLRRVVAPDEVFVVDSATAGGGVDWVARAGLTLVVIGPGWLDTVPSPARRIDNPLDSVRQEVEVALAGPGRVLPVLVGGATMPTADDLPPSLQALAEITPVELVDEHFREDVDQLSRTLVAVGHDLRRREGFTGDRGLDRLFVVLFLVLCGSAMIFLPSAFVAIWLALRARQRIRLSGGTKGLVLTNLGVGLAVFCGGISLLWYAGALA